MRLQLLRTILTVFCGLFFVPVVSAQVCVECHKKITPGIVADWQLSKHSQNIIECSVCHGKDHKTAQDVAKVKIPTDVPPYQKAKMIFGARLERFTGNM